MAHHKQITPQQYSFVLNYIANGHNVYQAAIDAGYKHSSASCGNGAYALLKKPYIQEMLAKAQESEQEKLNLTYNWKLKQLKAVIERNNNKGLIKSDAIVIKAIAELNKMQGDYAPDKTIKLTVGATSDKIKQVRQQYERY